jgi:hypothetical protein
MKTLLLFVIASSALLSVVLADNPRPRPEAKSRYTVSVLPPTSGADFFLPRRINRRGEVLGHLDASMGEFKDEPHVALYRDGTTLDLHLFAPGRETNRTSLPVDLNDRGDALFYTDDRYFIYRHGRLREAPQRTGPWYFEPAALNNAGAIVGTVYFENASPEATLYRHGRFHALGALPGLESEGIALNNRRQIIGRSGDHMVLFRRHEVVDLGGLSQYPVAINDRGDILGNASVRLRNGTEIPLSFSPAGINEGREIVGSTAPYSLSSRAMLQVHGVTHDLNDRIDSALGWHLMHASDINNRGQIVGWGKVNGSWSGFLLTPAGRGHGK